MRVIIVGCGRVGSGLAEVLARSGNDVTIIDISSESFGRLESDFPGTAVRGDGTDEDVLRRAGAEGADWFFGLTEGDNRNVLTAQMASDNLAIPHVVAKVNDPVRAEAYRVLGLATVCRTTMLVDALAQFAGLPHDPGVVGVSAATGQHPGGDHHDQLLGHVVADTPADALAGTPPEVETGAPAGGAAGAATTSGAATTQAVSPSGIAAGRRPWKLRRRNSERGAED